MYSQVFIVICAGIIVGGQSATIPDFIPLCKRHDPNLNQCYLKSFNIVLEHAAKGIPDLKLRKLEPVVVEKVSIDQTGSSLALDAELSNTKVYGLTGGRATSAEINLDELTFKISMEVPKIYMESNYNAKGKLLTIQFGSNGTFNGNITGITGSGLWTAEKEVKNGQTWVRNFKNKDFDLKLKDIKMYFDNLIPNKEINDETNRAINENIDLLYKDVSPIIISVIKTILSDAANKVYATYPLEVLYPE